MTEIQSITLLKEDEQQQINNNNKMEEITEISDPFETMRELTSQKDTWEKFVQVNARGVTVFRRKKSGRHEFEYLALGSFPFIPLETLRDTYLDIERRKKWDKYIDELRVISKKYKKGEKVENTNEPETFYCCLNCPYPMSKREYIYTRLITQKDDEIAVVQQSIVDPTIPQKEDSVRVTEYSQIIIATKKDTGSEVAMYYYDDSGDHIPKAIHSWAAQFGVPEFIESLQRACIRYRGSK